jgi:hypothetical protein
MQRPEPHQATPFRRLVIALLLVERSQLDKGSVPGGITYASPAIVATGATHQGIGYRSRRSAPASSVATR